MLRLASQDFTYFTIYVIKQIINNFKFYYLINLLLYLLHWLLSYGGLTRLKYNFFSRYFGGSYKQ